MQIEIDQKKVFVVHGRNGEARKALFSFLRSIGLHPIEWSEAIKATGKASPYVGEILDAAFSNAQAIVVLFTPDDEAKLREPFIKSDDEIYEKELTPQARPNVIFEAGMAMGRNPERTILVELGKLRPFSDVYGRHVVQLNNSTQRRQELAHRLETAGCAVNLFGTDWHTEGFFDDTPPLVQTITKQETSETNKDELKADEIAILIAIGEYNWGKTIKRLREQLNLKPIRLDYFLAALVKREFIEGKSFINFMSDPPKTSEPGYVLTEKGKEYVVVNDLI
jgi:DNA-binding MarR family transcriptional regulator